jgi:hypothetical protein
MSMRTSDESGVKDALYLDIVKEGAFPFEKSRIFSSR